MTSWNFFWRHDYYYLIRFNVQLENWTRRKLKALSSSPCFYFSIEKKCLNYNK